MYQGQYPDLKAGLVHRKNCNGVHVQLPMPAYPMASMYPSPVHCHASDLFPAR